MRVAKGLEPLSIQGLFKHIMCTERHWHHYDTISLWGNCVHSSLWSPDTGSTSAVFLDSEGCKFYLRAAKRFPCFVSSLSFSLSLYQNVNFNTAHFLGNSRRTNFFMLIIHNTTVCIFHPYEWVTALTIKGAINQNKAVQCLWQL